MTWEAVPGSPRRGIGRGERDGKEAQAECKWAVKLLGPWEPAHSML